MQPLPVIEVGRKRLGAFWPAAALALTAVAVIGMLVISNGNFAAGLAPLMVLAAAALVWKIPLRYPVYVVIYCGLTLNNPYEGYAHGLFDTPLTRLGGLLLANMNTVTGVAALNFSGMDVVLAYLWIVLFWRRARGSALDGPQVRTARPMRLFALVSMSMNFFLWGLGLARGGDFSHSMWQIHKVLELPLFFFLCQSVLRGPEDNAALGAVIVLAGIDRALVACWVRWFVPWPGPDPMPYATTHSDSMLFAAAFAILLAVFVEKRSLKALVLLSVGGLVVVAGEIANKRRLVWVEMGAIALTYFLISPWTWLKRGLVRAALIASPVLLLYVAVGWNSGNVVFAPIQTIRSVTDAKADASTFWRDMENLNLIYTIGHHPLLGPGWGHQYEEIIKLPDISSSFEAYRYHPHNGVLGLLSFAGLIGFSGMWVMLVVGVFLAARSYRATHHPGMRAAALCCIAAVVIYINQVYGDIGLPAWAGVFLVGPALAVAGKLATATGAWPRAPRLTASG